MTDVVLDSGALSLWARSDRRMLAVLEAAQRAGGVAVVPTVCLVESLGGDGRDAPTNRVVKGAQVASLTEELARVAAALRGAVDGDDVADPAVVATAAALDAVVVTTDPDDIALLAASTSPRIPVLDPRG